MSIYAANSAYYATPVVNGIYLGPRVNRPIPKQADDLVFTINQTYNLRPDLLAYDLYGDSGLWWVFAQRNPNALPDPLGDFRQGVTIYIPKIDTLRASLGF
jgi:hypothetical protein